MSDDLRTLLGDWPFDDGDDLTVRTVPTADGQFRIQIRLELGLLEMHCGGRPDGERPFGHDSLLDYHLAQARECADRGESYVLDHQQCGDLQRESMQYYHRRLSYLKLGEYRAAVADADHNLSIMDLLRDRAANRDDWLASEQFRSFVMAHRTRAHMLAALSRQDLPAARQAIDEGIAAMEQLYRDVYRQPGLLDTSDDLQGLRQLRASLAEADHVVVDTGESDEERIERDLANAVNEEDFERAARLRDALRRLRTGGFPEAG